MRYGGISLRSNYKCESGATDFQQPRHTSFLFYLNELSTFEYTIICVCIYREGGQYVGLRNLALVYF